MKNTCLAIGISFAWNINAQDIITLKNTEELKTKVVEVTDSQVKYRKWNNLGGPVYTLNKSEIFVIKYQNGDKDVFQDNIKPSVNTTNEIIIDEENLSGVCMKVELRKYKVNQEFQIDNCSPEGSSFTWKIDNNSETKGYKNESKTFSFSEPGKYQITLTAYNKDKSKNKKVSETIEIVNSDLTKTWDISLSGISPIGDFGNLDYSWGSPSNTNSSIKSGILFQMNNDIKFNEHIGIRTTVNYASMSFSPRNYSDVTENIYNSVKSFYLGVGPIIKSDKERITYQIGILLGLYLHNANNQYANYYDNSIGANFIIGEEASATGTLGVVINSEIGIKITRGFEIFARTEFFHASPNIPIDYVVIYNGSRNVVDSKDVEKPVNYISQGIGLKFWF